VHDEAAWRAHPVLVQVEPCLPADEIANLDQPKQAVIVPVGGGERRAQIARLQLGRQLLVIPGGGGVGRQVERVGQLVAAGGRWRRGQASGLLSTKRKACSAAPLLSGQSVKANNDKGPGDAGAFKALT